MWEFLIDYIIDSHETRNLGVLRCFSWIWLKAVLRRWCIFTCTFSSKHVIHFRYSMYLFSYKCFDDALLHWIYQTKEVFDGWSLVDRRSGHLSFGQEGLLMVRTQWRVDPVCEDLFKLHIWFWCCWWMNHWIFNCCLG